MITVQEVSSLGCTAYEKSCPIWIYNYLNGSTSYGGTVDQSGGVYGENYSYWTMNTFSTNHAYNMLRNGSIFHIVVTADVYGGRAVIMIKK